MGLHAWWDYWDCPGYPGILSTYGTPHLVGLPGTVLDIPGYLVPWCLMPDATYWDGRTSSDCPWYAENILSILGYYVLWNVSVLPD